MPTWGLTEQQRAMRPLAELRPLIISKDEHAKQLMSAGGMRYAFAADLVGNTICADLLDYLLRDHLYTGLPAAIGHRFTSAFFIVPARRGPYSERVALNIMQDGYERTDVLSELLKALRYRYELLRACALPPRETGRRRDGRQSARPMGPGRVARACRAGDRHARCGRGAGRGPRSLRSARERRASFRPVRRYPPARGSGRVAGRPS